MSFKRGLLLAALFSGFAGLAQAESSVTLYGLLDGGVGYHRFKGSDSLGNPYTGTRAGVLSGSESGNRWGLRGSEDLGEGLQAVFVLEGGFDLGTGVAGQALAGQGRLFGRQATVGLSSDAWGQLDFGRQTNVASKYFAGVATPFGTDWSQAHTGAAFSAAASLRYDNMIMYQTPLFAGLQLGVGYSFNASGNAQFRAFGVDQPNTRAWTAGLRYLNGPLAFAASYDRFRSPDTFGPGDDRNRVVVKSWALAASYDFDILKVHAAFGQTRNGWFGASPRLQIADELGVQLGNSALAVNDGLKVNSYALGLSAPVGVNGTLLAGWTMADPRNPGIRGVGRSKQNVYSLAYSYALSKRTNVYALGSYGDHVAFRDDLKSTFIAAGLRHRF